MSDDPFIIFMLICGLSTVAGLTVFSVVIIRNGIKKKAFAIPETPPQPSAAQRIAALPVDERLQQMRGAIQRWGWAQLVLGSVALFLPGLFSAPWGVVQIIVGLVSFFFVSDYCMFIVYSGAFFWTAATLVTTGLKAGAEWAFGIGVLVWAAFQTYQLFEAHRAASHANPTQIDDGHRHKIFPWLALSLGLGGAAFVALLLLPLIVPGTIIIARNISPGVAFASEVGALLGMMGAPSGFAALRAGYRPKAASIIGLVAGLIMIVIYIGLVFRLHL